jgi:transcription antitermination factor NusG
MRGGWTKYLKISVGEMVNIYGNLFVDFEGKVLLGRPRHKWEDNIKMGHKGIVHDGGID